MNKLMQGATSLDKKVGAQSIRNNTNRGNLGIVIQTSKDPANQKSGYGTPSNNVNSQYTLTAKKNKRLQQEINRSSKIN